MTDWFYDKNVLKQKEIKERKWHNPIAYKKI